MKTEDYKQLIIKHLLGEAGADEQNKLQRWRSASPDNQKLYDDFVKIWRNAPKSEPDSIPGIDDEWDRVAESLGFAATPKARVTQLKKPVQKPARQNRRYWAIAAMVFLIITTSAVFNRLRQTSDTLLVTAPAGSSEQVILPDGSGVSLNSVSAISYLPDFSGDERVVHLTGEAFFEVAKDGRPFIVETGNARIRVLGTVFDVWARDEQTRVIVQEGKVVLTPASGSGQILLTADQMGVYDGSTLSEAPIAVNAAERLGWLEGKIVFDKTPLAEIIAELQRIYDIPIQLADTGLGPQTLTASFERKAPERVLESICLALRLNFKKEGGVYVIRSVE